MTTVYLHGKDYVCNTIKDYAIFCYTLSRLEATFRSSAPWKARSVNVRATLTDFEFSVLK